ncbi:hypothetical protein [Salsipaludibacter albus]|uniref:hypothetical protein n=1 Tax=Salsipaludibacter albus TaxID=2849650 RepID=UPI001EE41E90|nr:hypothetical protein [Salsipaludibacter albus]MBY5160942.1 hypothetical protein [Salsipaludibacter albus]
MTSTNRPTVAACLLPDQSTSRAADGAGATPSATGTTVRARPAGRESGAGASFEVM